VREDVVAQGTAQLAHRLGCAGQGAHDEVKGPPQLVEVGEIAGGRVFVDPALRQFTDHAAGDALGRRRFVLRDFSGDQLIERRNVAVVADIEKALLYLPAVFGIQALEFVGVGVAPHSRLDHPRQRLAIDRELRAGGAGNE